MKYWTVFSLVILFSCTKTADKKQQKTAEDQCFVTTGINYDEKKPAILPPSADEILSNIPKHIHSKSLENFEPFSFVKEKYQENIAAKKKYFESSEYKTNFQDWISLLSEFKYLSVQKTDDTKYALAKNKYGLWLIEKTAVGKAKPYFLGLTQNFSIKIPETQNFEFLKEGKVVLNGTLLIVDRLSRTPIIPKYTVIKDGQQFSIDIIAVKKDSDSDGYNDLFEDFIGLNPNSPDSDGDGISDFEDLNPRFKSEASELASMYEAISDEQGEIQQYHFTEVLTDCPYFQQISPKRQRFLFYNTTEKLKLKDDVLNLYFPIKYSKIQRPKNTQQHETYFMDFGDEKGDGNLSAELIDGKWKVTRQYNLRFGM